jgi:hypothetical protein
MQLGRQLGRASGMTSCRYLAARYAVVGRQLVLNILQGLWYDLL